MRHAFIAALLSACATDGDSAFSDYGESYDCTQGAVVAPLGDGIPLVTICNGDLCAGPGYWHSDQSARELTIPCEGVAHVIWL